MFLLARFPRSSDVRFRPFLPPVHELEQQVGMGILSDGGHCIEKASWAFLFVPFALDVRTNP